MALTIHRFNINTPRTLDTDTMRAGRTSDDGQSFRAPRVPASLATQTGARSMVAALDRGTAARLQSATPTKAEVPTLPAEPTVDEAAAYLRATPQVATLDQMSDEQLRAYNVVLQDVGAAAVPHHEAWHKANGAGGGEGEGSGERFLGMHRAMMAEVERRVDPSGGWRAPAWDPTKPIPAQLTADGVERPADLAPIHRPGWLRAEGEDTEGLAEGNARFGESITIDGVTYDSLDDFEDPDTLGRALGNDGTSGSYHASAHGAIGGVMNTFASPSDPIFYGWHGHVDGILDDWLATPNGQAWSAANPDHPLLDPDAPMSTWDEPATDHEGH